MKTKLFLITDLFPYGKGEKTFIVPELPYLLQNFDVTIISRAGKAAVEDVESVTKLDEGINVIKIIDFMKSKKQNALQRKLRILYLFDKKVRQEFMDILKGENVIHRLKYMFSYYDRACKFLDALKKAKVPLDGKEQIIFYTYWHTSATVALLMCKEKNPNIKVITRTHRYDLYNEATDCGRHPFCSYVNSMIDAIFFISQQGMDYYVDRFSKGVHQSIFRLSRLGIEDYQTKEPKVKEKGFNLISCSYVVPVKRVELIIKALEKVDGDKEIHWTHFGDGKDLETVKLQAAELLNGKKNITYKFAGFVSNKEIMEYYRGHHVDCFITTTSSEGIPVSIMEACSFGIPIIATNVGGIPEIVEHNVNGLLLCANPSIDEIADAIEQMYSMPEEMITSIRYASRKIWEERYQGDKNFSEFVKCIKHLE